MKRRGMGVGKVGLEGVVQANLLGRREASWLPSCVDGLEGLVFLLVIWAGRMVVGIRVGIAEVRRVTVVVVASLGFVCLRKRCSGQYHCLSVHAIATCMQEKSALRDIATIRRTMP